MTAEDVAKINSFCATVSNETDGIIMCQITKGAVSYSFVGIKPIVAYLSMAIDGFILKEFMDTIQKPSPIVKPSVLMMPTPQGDS